MAKGARSSIRKNNNTKLKARVFGPVENARTQRLSAKLLELASQPKAPKFEMEVEEPTGKRFLHSQQHIFATRSTDFYPQDAKPADSETKQTSNADGASSSLSIPIPKSLACDTAAATAAVTLLTPPPSPPIPAAVFLGPSSRTANKQLADERLFFHLLGVSTDIQGFDVDGNLSLGFGVASDSSSSVVE